MKNGKTRLNKALEMYATDGYSLGKCVEVSGLSYNEFIKILDSEGMPYTLYE